MTGTGKGATPLPLAEMGNLAKNVYFLKTLKILENVLTIKKHFLMSFQIFRYSDFLMWEERVAVLQIG